MAWSRPTLAELVTRAEGFGAAGLELVSPVLRRAVVRVFARVVAGASHMLHGHISYLVDQIFPDRADEENLKREASLHGFTLNAAEYASGSFPATGTNGAEIPEDTIWVRADSREYRTQAGAVIAGGVANVSVVALLPGDDGNMLDGGSLRLSAPLAGVDSEAEIEAGDIGGGTDQESLEDFRERFTDWLKAEQRIGADADYIAWAREVAGVTRVWVARHELGLGTVVVRFVRDEDDDIIPGGAAVTAVQAKIDGERPTTADVTVSAPTADPVAFTISLGVDTPANRQAVEDELADLFFRNAEPGDGAGLGAVTLAEMRTAIGVAVKTYTLTTPTADHVPALGAFPQLGVITWS